MITEAAMETVSLCLLVQETPSMWNIKSHHTVFIQDDHQHTNTEVNNDVTFVV